jgi:hypothetical protein
MSVVAAIVQDNTIHMAGDTLVSSSDWSCSIREPKVFRYKNFLFGAVGDGRVCNVVHASFRPPGNNEEDALIYMQGVFAPALRRALKNDVSSDPVFEILVGYKERLYTIDHTYQVNSPKENYVAVGIGLPYSYGYLDGTKHLTNPEKRVKMAVRVAFRCPQVGGEVVYEKL